MRKITLLFTILSAALLFSGCEKFNCHEMEEGSYTGTFKVTYGSEVKTGTTTVKLKDSEYTCSASADRYPAGGSGTYKMKKGKITFNDKNSWTSDFDGNLILRGEYEYERDGNKLRIWSDNSVGQYEYDLKKK